MKRLFDIGVSLLVLLIVSPLLVVIALIIRLESPGKALFKQERVGRDRRPFSILKFRSMVENAEKVGTYFTDENDARVTRFGALLRKTSLDELPQLINVLRGDMSLVGPRPDMPVQKINYTDEEWILRHKVRPGITGLAQATSRSQAGVLERKQLDLEYVENVSFVTDCRILVKTLQQVLFKGSY